MKIVQVILFFFIIAYLTGENVTFQRRYLCRIISKSKKKKKQHGEKLIIP